MQHDPDATVKVHQQLPPKDDEPPVWMVLATLIVIALIVSLCALGSVYMIFE